MPYGLFVPDVREVKKAPASLYRGFKYCSSIR
jgi:hypothetical protein